MSDAQFKVGDYADLSRWDESERPANRLGVCRVTKVEQTRFCESGWMITVQTRYGATGRLDQNWLAPFVPT